MIKYAVPTLIVIGFVFLLGSFSIRSSELQNTSVNAERPLNHLLERYQTGEISSRRREIISPPVPFIEEPEIVRLKSQILDLRVENDRLREENEELKNIQRPSWLYIVHLINTKRDLITAKQSIRDSNTEAHILIDELIEHAIAELERLGYDSSALNDLIHRRDIPSSVVDAVEDLNRCMNENFFE